MLSSSNEHTLFHTHATHAQLRILMWKNRLLKQRQWISTLSEILLPVLIMLVLVAIRGVVSRENSPAQNHVADTLVIDTVYRDNMTQYIPSSQVRGGAGQKIAFIPGQAVATQKVIQAFKAQYPSLAGSVLDIHASDTAFTLAAKDGSYGTAANPYVQMALVLTNLNANADQQWEYTIRGNVSANNPQRSTALDTSEKFSNDIDNRYRDEALQTLGRQGPWLFLQDFMTQYIVNEALSANGGNATAAGAARPFQRPRVTFVPFPTMPYIFDPFATNVGDSVGLLFIVAFLWPVTRLVKCLVEEKELRIKEGMKMMSLRGRSVKQSSDAIQKLGAAARMTFDC